jgi:hypothetical protein
MRCAAASRRCIVSSAREVVGVNTRITVRRVGLSIRGRHLLAGLSFSPTFPGETAFTLVQRPCVLADRPR